MANGLLGAFLELRILRGRWPWSLSHWRPCCLLSSKLSEHERRL
jgi:hypothetical protein